MNSSEFLPRFHKGEFAESDLYDAFRWIFSPGCLCVVAEAIEVAGPTRFVLAMFDVLRLPRDSTVAEYRTALEIATDLEGQAASILAMMRYVEAMQS